MTCPRALFPTRLVNVMDGGVMVRVDGSSVFSPDKKKEKKKTKNKKQHHPFFTLEKAVVQEEKPAG